MRSSRASSTMAAVIVTLLAHLSIAASTTASTSVTSLLFFDTDPQPLDASIVAADSTAITYSIACATTSPCGFGESGATITAAGASYDYLASLSGEFTQSVHCALTGRQGATPTTGTCMSSQGGASAGSAAAMGFVNATVTKGDLTYMPVTITAGLAKLASASAKTTTSGAATTTTSGASGAATSSVGTILGPQAGAGLLGIAVFGMLCMFS